MDKNVFFQRLETRLRKYPSLLAPKNSWQIANSFMQAAHAVKIKMNNHFIRFKPENGDFWGYGMNTVSDGTEKNSNLDVEKIKYAEPLNRHHNKQCCILAFMIFKIQELNFVYEVFSINVPAAKMNTDTGTIPLKYLETTKLKTRQNPNIQGVPDVFVELNFSNKELPVSFQVDPTLHAEVVGAKYIEEIEEFARTAKSMEDNKKGDTNFYGEIKGSVHTGSGDINLSNKKGDSNADKSVKSSVVIALIVLDVIALIIASIWAYNSNWDFEPLIVILGLVGGLIGLIIYKSK